MNKQLDLFETGFNRLVLFFAALVAVSIGLIAILIPLNLFLIKFQLGNIWWLYESVEYALYVGVFIGAPWVLQQGAHVRVDVLISILPKDQSERLERFLDVAAAMLCFVLCVYGARSAISEFQDGTLPDKDLRIETGYMMVVFSGAFILLAIEFLLRMRAERVTRPGEKSPSADAGF